MSKFSLHNLKVEIDFVESSISPFGEWSLSVLLQAAACGTY